MKSQPTFGHRTQKRLNSFLVTQNGFFSTTLLSQRKKEYNLPWNGTFKKTQTTRFLYQRSDKIALPQTPTRRCLAHGVHTWNGALKHQHRLHPRVNKPAEGPRRVQITRCHSWLYRQVCRDTPGTKRRIALSQWPRPWRQCGMHRWIDSCPSFRGIHQHDRHLAFYQSDGRMSLVCIRQGRWQIEEQTDCLVNWIIDRCYLNTI